MSEHLTELFRRSVEPVLPYLARRPATLTAEQARFLLGSCEVLAGTIETTHQIYRRWLGKGQEARRLQEVTKELRDTAELALMVAERLLAHPEEVPVYPEREEGLATVQRLKEVATAQLEEMKTLLTRLEKLRPLNLDKEKLAALETAGPEEFIRLAPVLHAQGGK